MKKLDLHSALWLPLIVIILIQGGLRTYLAVKSDRISPDGTLFLKMAKQLPHDPKNVISRYTIHPGYPAVVAGVHWLMFGQSDVQNQKGWELAGRLVSLITGILTIIAAWLLARFMFVDWRIAFWAVMLLGFGRKFAKLGYDVLSDSAMLCLLFFGLVVAMSAVKKLMSQKPMSLLHGSVVGVFAGLGFLVRPEGLVLLPLAILLWFAVAIRYRTPWRVPVLSSAAAILTAVLVMTPYMMIVGGLTPKWIPEQFITATVSTVTTSPNLCLATLYPVEYPSVIRMIGQFFEAQNPWLASFSCVYLVFLAISRFRWGRKIAAIIPSISWEGGFLVLVTWLLISLPLCLRYSAVGAMSHRYLMLPAIMMAPFAAAGILITVRLPAFGFKQIEGWHLNEYLLIGAMVILSGILLNRTLQTKQCDTARNEDKITMSLPSHWDRVAFATQTSTNGC